ncbi:VOC family protein [Blastococcus saxobsidens]|uniref:VOC family protein n=1 Tax=Blastococcus saxobsidens TaxID=138336 RepID=A0A6L9W4G9_9ACTN|nr:VOC family protein [Blastococcus saxobsidens]NEK86371.1 VOC family protein [Blastococcus saxobsidens]
MTGFRGRHHTIDYVELTVPDLDRARRFYADAFGWQFTDYGPEYAGFRFPGDDRESGGLRLDTRVPGPGGPLVLLFSTDLDRTVAAVEAAGGEVAEGPYPFPGGRRFHFRDPSGNELGAWSET